MTDHTQERDDQREKRQQQARETVTPSDPRQQDAERKRMQEQARERADASTKEELQRADERRAD